MMENNNEYKFKVGDRVECTNGYKNHEGCGPFTGWKGTVRSVRMENEPVYIVTWDPIGQPRKDFDDLCDQYRLALCEDQQSKPPRHYSSMLIDMVDDGTIDPVNLLLACIHYMSEEQVFDMIKTSGYDWLLELEKEHNTDQQ